MDVRPAVVAFDVNETLSDMEPLRARFEDVGAAGHLLDSWFAATLRDGFALTAAGGYAQFSDVAADCLRNVLQDVEESRLEDAVSHVLSGFGEINVHSDVPEGAGLLHEAGLRLVTLTNGAVSLSEAMLDRAGVLDRLERCMSVDEVGRWKPAPEPYLYAAEQCGVPPEQVVLVAVHPWDIDGAKRAGLAGGWIQRKDRPYPRCFRAPDVAGPDLVAVAEGLLALGRT